MVGKQGSNATKMAFLLPRIHSWGMSGTPFRKNKLKDIHPLLSFIGYDSIVSHWNGVKSDWTSILKPIFHRNLKANVQQEIPLPEQKETIIYLSFSGIEQHYYDELMKKCKEAIDSLNNKASGLKTRVSELKSRFDDALLIEQSLKESNNSSSYENARQSTFRARNRLDEAQSALSKIEMEKKAILRSNFLQLQQVW